MLISVLVLALDRDQALSLLRELVNDDSVREDATCIPWTISNRYYSADVQFILRELTGWAPVEDELKKVPAVIFVWSTGQPYKEHAEYLSQQLSHYQFEVVLGVRLIPSTAPAVPALEDVQDIDCRLSSLGFEFVDTADSDSNRHDIPGVPRIIDALSAIMWPSMTQKSSPQDKPRSLIATMHQKGSILSESHHDLVTALLNSGRSRDDHTHRQLQQLAGWLDEKTPGAGTDDTESAWANDDNAISIWSTAVTPGNMTPHALSDLGSHPGTPEPGFDDDFTAFVSAPELNLSDVTVDTRTSQGAQNQPHLPSKSPLASSSSFSSTFCFESAASGPSTPSVEKPDHQSLDNSYLTPSNTSLVSYRPLGSVSDFGDSDTETCHECAGGPCSSEHEDDEMPTTAEIAETSRRIFGSVPLTASPTVDRKEAILPDGDDDLEALLRDRNEDEDLPDLRRFDLQEVLSALQGLKEEIAGMSDDKERRKAAAQVALGLVYGLDVDS